MNSRQKVLVITGPTASGKKRVALMAAELFDGEIVSADSRKVYRHLDIGTAKPSRGIRDQVPHHLIDIIEPDKPFSAGDWVHLATSAVAGVLSRGRLPIISGGTGFYIRAFIEGLTVGITPDPGVRETLARELMERGPAAMHQKLGELDPARAAEVSVNDTFRIMRSLEIVLTTGRPFAALREQERVTGGEYDYRLLTIAPGRDSLYARIDSRADAMVSAGLVDEVRTLLDSGYARTLTSLNTVGYREWFPFFDGKASYDECLDHMKRDTRRYAKRQMTWLRAQEGMVWIDPEEPGAVEGAFAGTERWLGGMGVRE